MTRAAQTNGQKPAESGRISRKRRETRQEGKEKKKKKRKKRREKSEATTLTLRERETPSQGPWSWRDSSCSQRATASEWTRELVFIFFRRWYSRRIGAQGDAGQHLTTLPTKKNTEIERSTEGREFAFSQRLSSCIPHFTAKLFQRAHVERHKFRQIRWMSLSSVGRRLCMCP